MICEIVPFGAVSFLLPVVADVRLWACMVLQLPQLALFVALIAAHQLMCQQQLFLHGVKMLLYFYTFVGFAEL